MTGLSYLDSSKLGLKKVKFHTRMGMKKDKNIIYHY